MKHYTVVGYHQDCDARFCQVYTATSPLHAEDQALEQHDNLVICATFPGKATPCDELPYVSYNQHA